jgi:hypothetical protein
MTWKAERHLGEVCRACGGDVLPVLYGMPGPGMWEAYERGEVILGGCMIEATAVQCRCGATGYDVDGRPSVLFTIDDARAFITEVRWKFASTMPQWPHEYSVRDWRPELDAQFVAFAGLIRMERVVKPWPADSPTPRYHHSYLAIDGWDYWTMEDSIDDTTLINRARLDAS